MFDRLLELFTQLFNEAKFWYVVKDYEEGILLRRGKYHKNVLSGLHGKLPFLDEPLKDIVVYQTITLASQSLITKDGKEVVVKGMIKFKISDIKLFLLTVTDAKDAVSDVTQGVIAEAITSKTWDECRDLDINNIITKKSRIQNKRFGIDTDSVVLTDKISAKSIRLFNEGNLIG